MVLPPQEHEPQPTNDADKFRDNTRKIVLGKEFAGFIETAEARPNDYPHAFIEFMATQGLTGIDISEEWGGTKLSPVESVGVIEEVARGHFGMSLVLLVTNSLASYGIDEFGKEEQKQKYLRDLAAGRQKGAFGLTEPNKGSDAKNIELKAEKVDGGWEFHGKKTFITGANGTDFMLVAARTGTVESQEKGITVFLADTYKGEARGVTVSMIEKIMEPGSPLCEVDFDGFFVREEDILGELNGGWEVLRPILAHSRNWIAARALGLAQAALDRITDYASFRPMYEGVHLKDLPMSSNTLEIMSRQIALTREIVTVAAEYEDSKHPLAYVLASLAKLVAADTADWTPGEAQQLFGAMGFAKEELMSSIWLDSSVSRAYEGAAPVQLEILFSKGWPREVIDVLLPPKKTAGFYMNPDEIVRVENFRKMVKAWEEVMIGEK